MKEMFTPEELDEDYIEDIDYLMEELPKLKKYIQCHKNHEIYNGEEIDEDVIDMVFPRIRIYEELILELMKCLLRSKYTNSGEGAKFAYKQRVHEISHEFIPLGKCFRDELILKNLANKLEDLYKDALGYCYHCNVPESVKNNNCPWTIEELMSNLDDFEYHEKEPILDRLPEGD